MLLLKDPNPQQNFPTTVWATSKILLVCNKTRNDLKWLEIFKHINLVIYN